MGESVGQPKMVVICALGGTGPCTPSPDPKLCFFSACFFYLESFPRTLSQTCLCTNTHSLSPLGFSSTCGGMQPLQVTQCAPGKGKGVTLDGCRSPAPAPLQGLALSLVHPLPSVESPRAMAECSRGASWRVPMSRHVPEEPPSASAPSKPHYIFALGLNQAHDQVP